MPYLYPLIDLKLDCNINSGAAVQVKAKIAVTVLFGG
jgi:hypothetical protein